MQAAVAHTNRDIKSLRANKSGKKREKVIRFVNCFPAQSSSCRIRLPDEMHRAGNASQGYTPPTYHIFQSLYMVISKQGRRRARCDGADIVTVKPSQINTQIRSRSLLVDTDAHTHAHAKARTRESTHTSCRTPHNINDRYPLISETYPSLETDKTKARVRGPRAHARTHTMRTRGGWTSCHASDLGKAA